MPSFYVLSHQPWRFPVVTFQSGCYLFPESGTTRDALQLGKKSPNRHSVEVKFHHGCNWTLLEYANIEQFPNECLVEQPPTARKGCSNCFCGTIANSSRGVQSSLVPTNVPNRRAPSFAVASFTHLLARLRVKSLSQVLNSHECQARRRDKPAYAWNSSPKKTSGAFVAPYRSQSVRPARVSAAR